MSVFLQLHGAHDHQSRHSSKIGDVSRHERRVLQQCCGSDDGVGRFQTHRAPQAGSFFDHRVANGDFFRLREQQPPVCEVLCAQAGVTEQLQSCHRRVTTPFVQCCYHQGAARHRLVRHRIYPHVCIQQPAHHRSSHSARTCRSYSTPLIGTLVPLVFESRFWITLTSGFFRSRCASSTVTSTRPLAGIFPGSSGMMCPFSIVASIVIGAMSVKVVANLRGGKATVR